MENFQPWHSLRKVVIYPAVLLVPTLKTKTVLEIPRLAPEILFFWCSSQFKRIYESPNGVMELR